MWYRLPNWNRGFIHQIASKESHTRFYTTMAKDLMTLQAPSSSAAAHPEPLPAGEEDTHSNIEDHYWMSKKHATSRDLRQWLAENPTDHALTVSLNCLLHGPITDKSSNRTFNLAYSTIYWHASKGTHMAEMNTNSLIKTVTTLSLSNIECTNTRLFNSSPQHTMHAG